MPSSLISSTPYKGLFLLILLFVALEYFFNTVSETKSAIFNSTKSTLPSKSLGYGPLLKTLLFKNNQSVGSDAAPISPAPTPKTTGLSYIVTVLPIFRPNLTTNSANVAALFEVGSVSASPENASTTFGAKSTDAPPCGDATPNLLGRLQVIKNRVPSIRDLEKRFAWLKPGGHWAPDTCTVSRKVAIVIPFRCRGEHLLVFLQHMHPFLKRQLLDYTIFIVEQDGDGPFNRAMLMNVGYVEALKARAFDCFVFHDIDLLPEDDRNLYTCPDQPRHMSVAVDIFKYRLPYPAIFGGVSAITTEHFKLLNGFSNSFWGWGGEDDDMSNRIRYHHLHISRYPINVARYTMLTHKKGKPSPNRYDMLKQGLKRFDTDGLVNLKYDLVQKKRKLLYTWLLVGIRPPS
ncbi:beta-1,4-N-acetylgalactosaminyltransferase bre-4-like [Cylas formicarius]|uniref:beta-1,4-N-acetylgalactosaminyltransferase bre-4-like n=1 Tax=Cylas formicarius TaxID=197179 RepID=UPI002958C112|nr:beta-1,4-N-acetylgalactosaminyltransferase bre-4-like [Cylas formicarius]XP_060523257.1 beta-1,4-N-acetylgalactosaminyltransferase bre-4-like [Cylas formicarius]